MKVTHVEQKSLFACVFNQMTISANKLGRYLYIQHGSKITTTFRKLFFRDIQTNDYIYSRQQLRARHTVPVLCIAIDLTIQILRQLSTLFIGTRA